MNRRRLKITMTHQSLIYISGGSFYGAPICRLEEKATHRHSSAPASFKDLFGFQDSHWTVFCISDMKSMLAPFSKCPLTHIFQKLLRNKPCKSFSSLIEIAESNNEFHLVLTFSYHTHMTTDSTHTSKEAAGIHK